MEKFNIILKMNIYFFVVNFTYLEDNFKIKNNY